MADYRLAHQCVGTGASAGARGGSRTGDKDDETEGEATQGNTRKEGKAKRSKRKGGDEKNGGRDQRDRRACYSFCMCPGGQIVPTSTDTAELCVNGMSFSKRSSAWANSGLVTTITEEDAAPFVSAPGREALAGLDFQRHIERKAAEMGGGNLVVPVQTAPDFIAGGADADTHKS